MILSTHSIVGAATAVASSNPITGFIAALLSHYILDTIPHWQYNLKSRKLSEKKDEIVDMVVGKNLFYDFLRIGIDIMFRLLISLLFIWNGSIDNLILILSGVAGGVLPDALQFLYLKIKKEPLISIHRFHGYFHNKLDWSKKPLLGISIQVVIILFVILIFSI